MTKLKEETSARQAREDAALLEPWEVPVPLIDHDPELMEDSATSSCALVPLPWHCATSTKASLNFETGAQEAARIITVTMISGEEMELLVQPKETVRALAERLALMKRVGRVKLLMDSTPLAGHLLVLKCVPHACVVTAVLLQQCGFDSPDNLDFVVEQQIRISCKMHGAGPAKWEWNPEGTDLLQVDPEAFWNAAFAKPTWREFAAHIGTQDFQITVFSYGLQMFTQTPRRFIEYNFGMGDNGFGSIHAENESTATARCDDGTYELLIMQNSSKFLEGLKAAARSKHGREEYGAW